MTPPEAPKSGCRGCMADGPFPVLSPDCPVHGEQARALLIDAIDNGTLIAAQPAGRCELCGAVKETRPYGPNGENVCFPCGMKDEDAMKRQFDKRMAGD